MKLVRHLRDLPFADLAKGSVVTIGSFDGLHLGHQQLLERVIRNAKAAGVPSIVMSFEPTPKEFFAVVLGVFSRARQIRVLRRRQRGRDVAGPALFA